MRIRKGQSNFDLSELLELENEVKSYLPISSIEEMVQYSLQFSNLAWEGLNILNRMLDE